MVTVTDDSTREDLALCLSNLVEQAKHEARRGYSGVMGKRYADLHASINAVLDGYERRVARELTGSTERIWRENDPARLQPPGSWPTR